jgi:hypothetical protein
MAICAALCGQLIGQHLVDMVGKGLQNVGYRTVFQQLASYPIKR